MFKMTRQINIILIVKFILKIMTVKMQMMIVITTATTIHNSNWKINNNDNYVIASHKLPLI